MTTVKLLAYSLAFGMVLAVFVILPWRALLSVVVFAFLLFALYALLVTVVTVVKGWLS